MKKKPVIEIQEPEPLTNKQTMHDKVLEYLQMSVCKTPTPDEKKISLAKTQRGNYALFYDDHFSGVFIWSAYIDEKLIPELGWSMRKKIFGT